MQVMEGLRLQEAGVRRGVFLQAFASPERIEGKCRLALVFQNLFPRRELEIHLLTLCFNHEGVKEYVVRTCPSARRQLLLKTLSAGNVSINLPEASALVQDAYRQNVGFQTRPAAGFTKDYPLLKIDAAQATGSQLVRKLCVQKISPLKFVRLYLSALRRLDSGLLYDLSTAEHQKSLGSRAEFFLQEREERYYTYYRSMVCEIKEQKEFIHALASIVVNSTEDVLLRITYRIVLVNTDSGYLVHDFYEERREVLSASDPDDPQNERVFYTAYQLREDSSKLSCWLDKEPDIFLAGEREGGEYYKWLKNADFPWSDFSRSASTFAEIYLFPREVVIFARKARNLMLAEKSLGGQWGDQLVFNHKGYLRRQDLDRALLARSEQFTDRERESHAVLVMLQVEQEGIYASLACKAEYVECLGDRAWYFFFQGRGPGENSVVEIYLIERWIKINAFRGEIEQAIDWLKTICCIREVIYQDKLKYDLPQTKRTWRMMGSLRRFNRAAEKVRHPALKIDLKQLYSRFSCWGDRSRR